MSAWTVLRLARWSPLTMRSNPFNVAIVLAALTDQIGVSAYDIYRNGVLVGSADGMTTTYTDLGLHVGDTDSYVVVARDAAGNAASSRPASVTVVGRP